MLRMLTTDVLCLAFDYLDHIECRRAAHVSSAWMQILGSRYVDVGRASYHNPDDAARQLFDRWDQKPPLNVTASLTVWNGLWQHRGTRERLQSVRVLYLDVFGYGVAQHHSEFAPCQLPPNLRRLVMEGPMQLIARPIFTPHLSLPQLEDVMVSGEAHLDDLSCLLRASQELRGLHFRDVRPVSILGAFHHLPVSAWRLRCLHVVNPNSNEFTGSQVLELLHLLWDAYRSDEKPRLTGLSLPVDANNDDVIWKMSQLLRRIVRLGAVVELVSIHRLFPAARVWRMLLENCEPSVARVYWFMDDFNEVESNAYHGRLPCFCSHMLGRRIHGLVGSFDGNTDLQALPNSDRYGTVSVSTALPRTFPRYLQCIRIACFTNDIIVSCFAWMADPTGCVTTVKDIELHFQWFGLRWRIPEFPSLAHARELRSLHIGQDGSAQGVALSGVLAGAGVAPALRLLDLAVAFDDSQSPLIHLPHVLFPVLEELHTTCLRGLPVRADYWLRSSSGLQALTLLDEIRLLKKQPTDTQLVNVVADVMQVLSVETEGVHVDVRVRLSCDTTWPLPDNVGPRFFDRISKLRRPGRVNICLLGLSRRDSHRLSHLAMRLRPRESLTVVCHTNLTMLQQLRRFLCNLGISVLEMPQVITVEVLQNEFTNRWLKEFSSMLPALLRLGPQFRINVHNTRYSWDVSQLTYLRKILSPYRSLIHYTFW